MRFLINFDVGGRGEKASISFYLKEGERGVGSKNFS